MEYYEMRYGVWCTRSSFSVCGSGAAWLKSKGKIKLYKTMAGARKKAASLNESTMSGNVFYSAKEYDNGY